MASSRGGGNRAQRKKKYMLAVVCFVLIGGLLVYYDRLSIQHFSKLARMSVHKSAPAVDGDGKPFSTNGLYSKVQEAEDVGADVPPATAEELAHTAAVEQGKQKAGEEAAGEDDKEDAAEFDQSAGAEDALEGPGLPKARGHHGHHHRNHGKRRRDCAAGNCTRTFTTGGFPDGVACSHAAPFFGYLGLTIGLVCSIFGAAYGTVKTGIAVATIGVQRPDLTTRGIIPIVMAELLGIYGLIVSVIIAGQIANARPGHPRWDTDDTRWAPGAQMLRSGGRYSSFQGYAHLGAGCCVGFSSLVAGVAIGTIGERGIRDYGNQDRLFVVLLLILIFAEALGLYGLIVALILSQKGGDDICV